jgi:Flp pilus assembly protein TadG
MRGRRCRWEKRNGRGQSLVETALVLPLFLVVVCGAVDTGRLGFTISELKYVAEYTARQASLVPNRTSDCTPLSVGIEKAYLTNISVDPLSISTQSSFNPTAATSIPSNQGYVYIYPAVSIATPQLPGPTNCTGAARPSNQTIQVQVTYHFTAWTPIPVPLNTLFLTTDATAVTEY